MIVFASEHIPVENLGLIDCMVIEIIAFALEWIYSNSCID